MLCVIMWRIIILNVVMLNVLYAKDSLMLKSPYSESPLS
jgi:hypothetical protein